MSINPIDIENEEKAVRQQELLESIEDEETLMEFCEACLIDYGE